MPLACIVLFSARSCRSSICLGHLSTAWLVSLVFFSFHMVSRLWHARSISNRWGGCYTLPRTISFFSHCWLYLWRLSSPGPRCWSFYPCKSCWAYVSFRFRLCGRNFVLCLLDQCPRICIIWHSWQHTWVVHLSLQADGNVTFEDIPVFGVCRPACHDSSLYIFVMVLFLEAVALPQVYVAVNIFYQNIVNVYLGCCLQPSPLSLRCSS